MASDERESIFVPHADVAKREAEGWIDTGESPDHHSGHSHLMYRYVDEAKPSRQPDQRVKASTARTEAGEVVLCFVTETGFSSYRISADNLASHIGRCVRAMSDLVK